MRFRIVVPALASALFALPAVAQQKPDAPPAASVKKPDAPEQARNPTLQDRSPLPPDKSIEQVIIVHGKTLHYTATVGTIELEDRDGKPTGEVVYTAYTLDHSGGSRPVTFALNGGPGASSVYLNLGAIGPKRVTFGNEGDSPSDPATLTDNPATWLDFTDLVFLDPIGTGFSRSLVDEAQTRKLFYTPQTDIEYLSLVIYKWLVKSDRLLDKKYLAGESYGGYRVPRITQYLQADIGVAMNGIVLVSPYLNPDLGNSQLSPTPWMVSLPSIVAGNLERQQKLTDDAMQPVIAYDEGEYATALIKGNADPAATQAMIAQVTELTGLDPQYVKHEGGRLDIGSYLREAHREQGRLASIYDSNVTAPDPFPYAARQQSGDPILASIVAPTTTAMVNFITNTVGWKDNARYYALSGEVNEQWDGDSDVLRKGAVGDLRKAVSADPKLRVLIVHGWNDLSCPFMGSVLTVNQMPPMGEPGRVSVREFPGGHMFYTRTANGEALHSLAETMVSTH